MFTRKLLKHFFTFSLFALMLLPQISGPGSAIAAGIQDAPEVHCLDVSGSVDKGGSTGPSASPPGTEVDLRFHYDTMNNCTQTVTGIIHGGCC